MFEPQNDFEICLMDAASNPSARPKFYQQFEGAFVFLITQKTEEGILKEGDKLAIHNIEVDGEAYIPIFTSLLRLKQFVVEDVSYVTMKALDFFNMTAGALVILNPGSEYGKEFSKEEIKSILDGSIWRSKESYLVEREVSVQIGLPATPPTELLNELRKLFKTIKEVKSAYNVHYYNPDDGLPPHTLIGIEATGNWDRIISSAGIVTDGVRIPNPPVDFLQIDEDEFANGLRAFQPFYKRKVLGLF